MELRKQYHFRPGPNGLQAWDIHRLIKMVEKLPTIQIPLSAIRELDEPYWYGHATPTCRSIAEHAKLGITHLHYYVEILFGLVHQKSRSAASLSTVQFDIRDF